MSWDTHICPTCDNKMRAVFNQMYICDKCDPCDEVNEFEDSEDTKPGIGDSSPYPFVGRLTDDDFDFTLDFALDDTPPPAPSSQTKK